jgi:hypothetical protein
LAGGGSILQYPPEIWGKVICLIPNPAGLKFYDSHRKSFMQQFTVLHDGTQLGWQTVYYAFHFAARLGAPTHVYLLGDQEQDESQVGMTGRAAGVSLTTSHMDQFSLEVLAAAAGESDGLFLPRSSISNKDSVLYLVESSNRPVWVVSRESGLQSLAVLVDDKGAAGGHFIFAWRLAQRIQKKVIALSMQAKLPNLGDNQKIIWRILTDNSNSEIIKNFEEVGAGFLFIPLAYLDLVRNSSINLVIIPDSKNQE